MMAVQAAVTSHIRKINVRKDLLEIADLIEICFAATLDEDGREYLRQLRWTSRDLTALAWLQGAAERIASPLYGFVWEEDGRIVGNLSLIPLNQRGKLIYLIANVAVHPNYRRRGIGNELTRTALEHLRQRGIEMAWLQVRDDNPVAYHLYRTLGFIERARRTTWQISGLAAASPRHVEGVTVHARKNKDWEKQAAWLKEIYPPEVAWNLPLSPSRLSPGLASKVMRWMRGEMQDHWSAVKNGETIGVLSWEPMRSAYDALWLASDPRYEEEAILALLPHACSMLTHRRRGLSVNYPAGRAGDAFLRAGFAHHQTLIWMSIPLHPQE